LRTLLQIIVWCSALLILYIGGYFAYYKYSGRYFREDGGLIDCQSMEIIRTYHFSNRAFTRSAKSHWYDELYTPCVQLHKYWKERGSPLSEQPADFVNAFNKVSKEHVGYRYCRLVEYPMLTGFKSVYEFYRTKQTTNVDYVTFSADANGVETIEDVGLKNGLTNR